MISLKELKIQLVVEFNAWNMEGKKIAYCSMTLLLSPSMSRFHFSF